MNNDLCMDCPIEKKLFVSIDVENLRTRELIFFTEIILKNKPNSLTKRLIEIIKDGDIYKNDLY